MWTKILDTAIHKNKINNTHYWVTIHQTTKALNEVPDYPLKGKFNEKILELVSKHFTPDRKWHYYLEKAELFTLYNFIEKRDESKLDDHFIKRAEIDMKILQVAKEAEKRLKRLKIAKYSSDLFDEIIEEMMREKKTIMEMLAELDCEEE